MMVAVAAREGKEEQRFAGAVQEGKTNGCLEVEGHKRRGVFSAVVWVHGCSVSLAVKVMK
jgi:hypothetical protein